MKKHQMIASFVAVILVAAAASATAATMRSASSTHLAVAPSGSLVLNELTVDVNKLPTEDFEDLSLVYSKH